MKKTTSSKATKDMDAASPEQGIEVRAQYLKDLSFENPRSLSINPDGPQPNISVNVEAKASHLSENTYEVVLNVNVEATQSDKVIFILEMIYGGIFVLNNIAPEMTEVVILIECPRLLFPFARNVVADLVREGGFPPLLLNPIDFAALYYSQKK
ncbi:MAG: protein-export chaperone SecB [Alphaproteobacteria bacterium 43-37]|nr:MAG: protein-export chaperone SecB [Alphaproteobacteria bacterium 43-37]